MGPDIRRVVADEDGDVADDLYAFAPAVGVQRAPLLKERELQEAGAVEFVAQFFADRRHCLRLAMRQLVRPGVPAPLLVAEPQSVEQNVIFQPPGVFGDETIEARARFAACAEQKPGCGLLQKRQLFAASPVRNRPGLRCASSEATRSCEIMPRSASRSRLTSRTLPANAEVEE